MKNQVRLTENVYASTDPKKVVYYHNMVSVNNNKKSSVSGPEPSVAQQLLENVVAGKNPESQTLKIKEN